MSKGHSALGDGYCKKSREMAHSLMPDNWPIPGTSTAGHRVIRRALPKLPGTARYLLPWAWKRTRSYRESVFAYKRDSPTFYKPCRSTLASATPYIRNRRLSSIRRIDGNRRWLKDHPIRAIFNRRALLHKLHEDRLIGNPAP